MSVNWYALVKEEEKLAKRRLVKPRKDESRKTPEIIKFSPDRDKLWADGILYKQIPGYENYYISKEMVVKNQTGRTLRNKQTSNDSQLKIRVNGIDIRFFRHELLWAAWPEFRPITLSGGDILWNGERWRFVEGFDRRYIISESGIVRNYKSWSVMKASTDRGKRVHLFKDGKQKAFTVHKLVEQHFPKGI